jgi:hypothetical protein
MRALTPTEELEFQGALETVYINMPVADVAKFNASTSSDDSRYAVMTRVRLTNVWTWTTWQVYQTYDEAVLYARESDKVVRFRSEEWAELCRRTEPVLPWHVQDPAHVELSNHKEKSFVNHVHRVLDYYGYAVPSRATPSTSGPLGLPCRHTSTIALALLIDFIDLILGWIDKWELSELERMHAKHVPQWLETIRERARRALEHNLAD